MEIVSTGMWETYRTVAHDMFPSAVVAVDKFHILQEMHRKIDRIRIKAMYRTRPPEVDKEKLPVKERTEYDRKDKGYYLLKKFHWLIFKNDDNMKKKIDDKEVNLLDPNHEKKYNKKMKQYLNFYDILDMILRIDNNLLTAYNLKFKMDQFYKTCTYEKAGRELSRLIIEFRDSGIEEMIAFSNTLARWKQEIINSFIIVD